MAAGAEGVVALELGGRFLDAEVACRRDVRLLPPRARVTSRRYPYLLDLHGCTLPLGRVATRVWLGDLVSYPRRIRALQSRWGSVSTATTPKSPGIRSVGAYHRDWRRKATRGRRTPHAGAPRRPCGRRAGARHHFPESSPTSTPDCHPAHAVARVGGPAARGRRRLRRPPWHAGGGQAAARELAGCDARSCYRAGCPFCGCGPRVMSLRARSLP